MRSHSSTIFLQNFYCQEISVILVEKFEIIFECFEFNCDSGSAADRRQSAWKLLSHRLDIKYIRKVRQTSLDLPYSNDLNLKAIPS